MSTRFAKLHMFDAAISFSAAHFTIFSATERENLHGHNYTIAAVVESAVDCNGLCMDYRLIEASLQVIADQLNQRTLIPRNNPHLLIEHEECGYRLTFATEVMVFLPRDALILPVINVTVEELSHYVLNRLRDEAHWWNDFPIHFVEVRVASSPGREGSSTYLRE